MAVFKTNWQDRLSPFDALVGGKVQPVPWLFGSNAPVFIDLTALLASGESPTFLASTLRRLPVLNETDYTDFSVTGLEGIPVASGNIVSQLLKDLARGYVYRWELLFGPADNRRGASLLVECVE